MPLSPALIEVPMSSAFIAYHSSNAQTPRVLKPENATERDGTARNGTGRDRTEWQGMARDGTERNGRGRKRDGRTIKNVVATVCM